MVKDNDLARKVLYLDGNNKYAKVAINNYLQDPLRLIDGFSIVINMKIMRLNVDNMYFIYGNGLEIFTLTNDLIIKYQTDKKEWQTAVPNLRENKWYLFNITWTLDGGLKVYIDDEVILSPNFHHFLFLQ